MVERTEIHKLVGAEVEHRTEVRNKHSKSEVELGHLIRWMCALTSLKMPERNISGTLV